MPGLRPPRSLRTVAALASPQFPVFRTRDAETSVGKAGMVVEGEFPYDIEESAFLMAVEVLIVKFD